MCDRVSVKYPTRQAVEPHSYYMSHIKGWTMERQPNESDYASFCHDATVWNGYPHQLNHERPPDLTYPSRRVHEQELGIDFTTPYQEFPGNPNRHVSGQRFSRFPQTTSNPPKGEPVAVENYSFSDSFWDSNRDRYPPSSAYPNSYIPANAYSSIPIYGQTPSPVKCQQHTRQVLNSSRPFCVDGKRSLSADQEESDTSLDSEAKQKALKFPWMKTTKSHHYEWKAQWQQG